mgnify:CR=1 FL=1
MTVSLRGLSTAVPATQLVQTDVQEVFGSQPGLSRLAQRIVSTSFGLSGIERRYTVLEELTLEGPPAEDPSFYDRASGLLLDPFTVRHKHPQLEGDDFCKTPEGLETINRALVRPTNLQTHIARNAAARQRQAAAQIDLGSGA